MIWWARQCRTDIECNNIQNDLPRIHHKYVYHRLVREYLETGGSSSTRRAILRHRRSSPHQHNPSHISRSSHRSSRSCIGDRRGHPPMVPVSIVRCRRRNWCPPIVVRNCKCQSRIDPNRRCHGGHRYRVGIVAPIVFPNSRMGRGDKDVSRSSRRQREPDTLHQNTTSTMT